VSEPLSRVAKRREHLLSLVELTQLDIGATNAGGRMQ
jgi:hypothetical protein